jgi:DnaK suppressor protein
MNRWLPEEHLGGMQPSDLASFKRVLETAQAGLEQSLRSRDGIVVERASDPTDEAQHAYDQELTIRVLDRESGRLAAIKAALQRVAERTYGICDRCECDIGVRRLAAVPWASYCVRCQEIADRRAEIPQLSTFDLDHAA